MPAAGPEDVCQAALIRRDLSGDQGVGGLRIEGQHAGLVGLLRHVGKRHGNCGADLGGPVGLGSAGRGEAVEKALEDLSVGAQEAVLLIAEVLVEGGARDAGVGSDVSDGHLGVAIVGERPPGACSYAPALVSFDGFGGQPAGARTQPWERGARITERARLPGRAAPFPGNEA